MAGTARLLVALGALFAAAPLAAQSAPPPAAANDQAAPATGSEIVVAGKQAQEPTPKEVLDEARGITRVGRYDLYEEALPRFWGPVCPGVAGIRTDVAEALVDRMRQNIARLKIQLANGECSPNLIVVFAKDGRSLLDDLQRDRPGIFQLVSEAEKAELLADKAPVHVWNNIAKRWTGGGAPPRDGKASVWGQLDRTIMPWSYDIVAALVVFDHDAAAGLTVNQLADYATMRGLSHTRPVSGEQQLRTILSLFDEDHAGPDELTDFDVGYLRSLYWWLPSTSAANKLVNVHRWIEKGAKDTVKR